LTSYEHKIRSLKNISLSSKDAIIYQHKDSERVIKKKRQSFTILSLASTMTLFMFFVLYISLLFSMNDFYISPFVMTSVGILLISIRMILHLYVSEKNPFIFIIPHPEMNKRMSKSTVSASLLLDFSCIAILLLFLLIYNIQFISPLSLAVAIFGYLTLAIDLIIIYIHHVHVSGFELVNGYGNQSSAHHDEKEKTL
jgi:hypothetical protein